MGRAKKLAEQTDPIDDPDFIDDPDNPELTEEDFAKMRPLREVFPEIAEAYRRGELRLADRFGVTLDLDRKILDHFRFHEDGFEDRLNEALLGVIQRGG